MSSASRAEVLEQSRPVHVTASRVVRQEGDACEAVTLLLTGALSVSKRRETGREVLLYTVRPGELCVLEVLSVVTGAPFRGEAVTETAVSGAAVPAALFRRLVDREPAVRSALFASLESRLASSLELVSEMAFSRLESRLAGALLRHVREGLDVHATHERLAQELACGREAVSRTLGAWERLGIVQLGRGRLQVVDAARLAALASPAHEGLPPTVSPSGAVPPSGAIPPSGVIPPSGAVPPSGVIPPSGVGSEIGT